MIFKFAAQTRLSELHDEIEKAEQQILKATEEFKQLEEAIQLKKVRKYQVAMQEEMKKMEYVFSLHNHVMQILNQCCLINYRVTILSLSYGSSIFQLHFPSTHDDILFFIKHTEINYF